MNQLLRDALRALLTADGHTITCSFNGCDCGSIEDYLAARSQANRVLRMSEPSTKALCKAKDNETTVAGGVPPSVPQADGCSDWREMDPLYPGI